MKIKEFRRSLPRKTLLEMNHRRKSLNGINLKASTSAYPGTLKTTRKVFNRTGKYLS